MAIIFNSKIMFHWFHKHPFASLTSRVILAEIIHLMPSVDQLTAIAKLLVQIILLATAVLELYRRWKRKPEKRAD